MLIYVIHIHNKLAIYIIIISSVFSEARPVVSLSPQKHSKIRVVDEVMRKHSNFMSL